MAAQQRGSSLRSMVGTKSLAVSFVSSTNPGVGAKGLPEEGLAYSLTGLEVSLVRPGKLDVATSEDLLDMAMYVPELVLRRFVSCKQPTFPEMVSLQGAVLFADVSGFTQLTAKLQECATSPARGAEELNCILSEYFDLLIACFHKHGGDVVSFSGDAMTVLFEAEKEKEKDAEAEAGGAPATQEALALASLQAPRV